MPEYKKEDVIKTLNISVKTLNRYLKEFHEILNIDKKNDKFSSYQVDKLLFIKERLERPTYKNVKKTLYNEKYYNNYQNRKNKLFYQKENKSLSLFASIASILGFGIGVFSLFKSKDKAIYQEIESLSQQFNDFTNTINSDFDVKLKNNNPNRLIEDTNTKIQIDREQLPNTFIPNGDGTNDSFMRDWKIEIYNRDGILLYKGTEGWDGYFNGKPVANDTYLVIIYDSSEWGANFITNYVTIMR